MADNGEASEKDIRISELTQLVGEQTLTVRKLIAALEDRDRKIAENMTEIAAIRKELDALKPGPHLELPPEPAPA